MGECHLHSISPNQMCGHISIKHKSLQNTTDADSTTHTLTQSYTQVSSQLAEWLSRDQPICGAPTDTTQNTNTAWTKRVS
jgi:hypothetical protein